jgi:tripartite-type tricarboxylate transporter receptor subunit TctC
VGTVQHLTARIISRDAGIEMLHIPYANSGQALKEVQAGEVPVFFTFLGPIDALLRGGHTSRVRAQGTSLQPLAQSGTAG